MYLEIRVQSLGGVISLDQKCLIFSKQFSKMGELSVKENNNLILHFFTQQQKPLEVKSHSFSNRNSKMSLCQRKLSETLCGQMPINTRQGLHW